MRSSGVFPVYALDNSARVAVGNAELGGNVFGGRAISGQASNFPNVHQAYFGVLMLLSHAKQSVAYGVLGVLERCRQVQMLRINAISIVALVANKKAIWDRAVVDGPRDAVCSYLAAVSVAHVPVPEGVPTLPFPAPAPLFHFRPEPICYGGLVHFCAVFKREQVLRVHARWVFT